MYVDKGEFELAKQYCKDNPAHIDQVLVKQAEILFKEKEWVSLCVQKYSLFNFLFDHNYFCRYEKSALIYADTHSSFEEISLKFLQEWQIEALKTFLRKVWDRYLFNFSFWQKKINFTVCFKKLDGLKTQDKTQITMIIIWVIELFMNQMGILRSSNTSYLHDPQYIKLQKQFDSFLANPKVEVLSKNKHIMSKT